MKDSQKQQTLDACGGMKSAADIIGLLSSLSKKLRRQFPDDLEDSSRLRVVISAPRLAIQAGIGKRQALRAIQLLIQRGFIIAHKSAGETTGYYVVPGAIERWVQPMPLFEQPAEVTGTSDMKSPVPVTSCHRYQCHKVTGPTISSYISFSSSGDDDAQQEQSEEKTEARPRQEVGLHPQPESQDGERGELIERFREVGLPPEKAETLLRQHSRQKINAAFAHLNVRLKRGDTISRPFGRFILSFLAAPGDWEHEYDLTSGCWVPTITLARRASLAKARDRPALPAPPSEPLAPHWAVWNACSPAERELIRQHIDQLHPSLSARSRESLYAQEALRRKHESQTRTDTAPVQGRDGSPAGAAEGAGRAGHQSVARPRQLQGSEREAGRQDG